MGLRPDREDPTRAGPFARFLRVLERPRALAAIAVLAAILSLPTLTIGFYNDDYAHLMILEGDARGSGASALDLYHFVSTDRAELHGLVARGPLPWWSDPALKLHLFRPLTSASIAMDHALFGRVAVWHHVTGILLYVMLVIAAGLLHRRLAPTARGVAALGTLIFAVSAAHAQPIAWSAGRHLLIAPLFVALALAAHLRWRRDGWRPGAWLGPISLVAALSAGEAALGGIAYWLAHAFLGPSPRGGWRARMHAALPAIGIAIAYTVFYKARGYGIAGSGAYIDPATDPVRFAEALLVRVPALIADASVGFPAEIVHIAPVTLPVVLGVACAALTFALYRVVRPGIPDEERAALRWVLPGALVSLVLATGGFLGSRLLVLPGLGGAFFFAVLLVRGADRIAHLAPGRIRSAIRVGFGVLFVVHLVLAPIALVANCVNIGSLAKRSVEAAYAADFPGLAGGRIVIVAASDPAVSFYSVLIRIHEFVAADSSWQVLSMAKRDHRVTRTGPSTLRLDVVDGRMMEGSFEKLFRSPGTPFRVGDHVALDGVTVTVIALDRGAPTAIEARFDVPLEDPRLHVLAWQSGRLARIRLPREGESVVVPWSPGPFQVF